MTTEPKDQGTTEAGSSGRAVGYGATANGRSWSEYHETSLEELVKMFAESLDDIGRQDRVGLMYWLDSRTQSVVIRIDLFKDD